MNCFTRPFTLSPLRRNASHQSQIKDANILVNDDGSRHLQASMTMFSGTCNDGTPAASFETFALLNLIGRPSLVSDNDLKILEETFVEAYNDLLNCTLPGASLTLDNATIISNSDSNTTNATLPTNTSSPSIQQFTYLVIAHGRSCDLCGSNTSTILFSNSSPSGRRELDQKIDKSKLEIPNVASSSLKPVPKFMGQTMPPDEIQSGYPIKQVVENRGKVLPQEQGSKLPGEQDAAKTRQMGAGGVTGHQDAKSLTRRMKTRACACRGPNESAFVDRMSSLLFAASATNATTTNISDVFTSIVGASQLLNRNGCNANNA